MHLLAEEGMADRVHVDSAGTGAWHAGEPPDPRSSEVALRYGVRLRGRARQVIREDFHAFTHVIAMDRENLRNLEALQREAGGIAHLNLLRDWDPEATGEAEVPDPYYGGPGGFETVYRMVERSCRALLDELRDDVESSSRDPRDPGDPRNPPEGG